jgi:hypothetical protein
VAGDGGEEGEPPRQWWAFRGIVRVAAAQRLHGGAAGVGGGQHACCSVGEVAAGPQWWGGTKEAAGVTLCCWCICGVVVKIYSRPMSIRTEDGVAKSP